LKGLQEIVLLTEEPEEGKGTGIRITISKDGEESTKPSHIDKQGNSE